ncbi:MAG TPA: hydroxysqualene dehydroxylase HpnE [Streptosporangiaceae bacterium]
MSPALAGSPAVSPALAARPAVSPAVAGSPAVRGRHVVVIGGGLSGLSASIALRDAGLDITMVEARPRLGGAASSYQRGDLTVDNGQHVFLRCCTSYLELIERLGATGSVAIQERFDVTVLSPGGQARLRRTGLPSPLHMTGALNRYRHLSMGQRLRVARAALALRLLDPADPELDRIRLGDWLAARGQDERTRRVLWDLFVVSSLNIAGDEASLSLATTVIKTALLGARDAADIGMAKVPLGDLHGRAAADLLARIGVQVRLATKASGVRPLEGGGIEVAAGGEVLRADAVVLAVPAGQAARLAGGAGVEASDRWADLGASPIVNVHLVYDRPVTHLPLAAAVDSPVQWVFDKTRQSGVAAGQYLAVSLSAADDYVDVPVATLREQFVPAMEGLFPAAAQARITDFFVTRERRATFRQGPGAGGIRPGSQTPVRGLVVAGAWTDTGWPDTMEGAVRSGHNAAQEVIRQAAAGLPGPAAGTQPDGLTRPAMADSRAAL